MNYDSIPQLLQTCVSVCDLYRTCQTDFIPVEMLSWIGIPRRFFQDFKSVDLHGYILV